VGEVTELFLSLVILLFQRFHIQVHHFDPPRRLFLFASRAATAFLAISERCSGVRFLARAFPPRLPNSTADESFFFAMAQHLTAKIRRPSSLSPCWWRPVANW
jgi:hypothetical protein